MDRPIRSPRAERSGAMSVASSIALVLLVVGGINWALVGLFAIDLVATLFGTMTVLSRIVYVAVGVAAIYAISMLPKMSRLT